LDYFEEDLSHSNQFYNIFHNENPKTLSNYIREIFYSINEISVNQNFMYKGLFNFNFTKTKRVTKLKNLKVELYFRKIINFKGEIIEFYFNDVSTLLEKVEKEKEQKKIRSSILAKISHEFKTPLITIIYILKNYLDYKNKNKIIKKKNRDNKKINNKKGNILEISEENFFGKKYINQQFDKNQGFEKENSFYQNFQDEESDISTIKIKNSKKKVNDLSFNLNNSILKYNSCNNDEIVNFTKDFTLNKNNFNENAKNSNSNENSCRNNLNVINPNYYSNLKTITSISSISDSENRISLKNKSQKKKSKNYLINTIDLSDYMLTLISDIIDFSIIDSKFEFKCTYDDFNLHNLFKFCHRMIKILIDCKGLGNAIQPILEIDESIPQIFCSDEMRIKQVILNMISNSIKFTRRGHIKIMAKLKELNNIEISIEDTGIGIQEKDLKKLFQEYSKLGSIETQKMNSIGSGLVLSICKRIVKKLGKEISVESIPGKKTIFYFNILNKNPSIRRCFSSIDIKDLSKNGILVSDEESNYINNKIFENTNKDNNQGLQNYLINKYNNLPNIYNINQEDYEKIVREKKDLNLKCNIKDSIEEKSDNYFMSNLDSNINLKPNGRKKDIKTIILKLEKLPKIKSINGLKCSKSMGLIKPKIDFFSKKEDKFSKNLNESSENINNFKNMNKTHYLKECKNSHLNMNETLSEMTIINTNSNSPMNYDIFEKFKNFEEKNEFYNEDKIIDRSKKKNTGILTDNNFEKETNIPDTINAKNSTFFTNLNYLDFNQNEELEKFLKPVKKFLKHINTNKEIILIADDNEIIRNSIKKLIKKNLGKTKYRTICIRDGIEVLYLVMLDQNLKNSIRYIISDEQMVFLNGSQLHYNLNQMQIDKKINYIPFIHCSSDAGNTSFLNQHKIKYTLNKPPNKKEILKLFEQIKLELSGKKY